MHCEKNKDPALLSILFRKNTIQKQQSKAVVNDLFKLTQTQHSFVQNLKILC